MENLWINLGIFAFLIMLGWLSGSYAEKSHLKNLAKREDKLSHMLVTDIKTFPPAVDHGVTPVMIMGEAVIATDYLKSFLAKIRNIFGGEIRSFESLMSRARREAILRVMEQAEKKGYNAVCNIRLNSSDIGGMTGRRKAGAVMVEIFATGTAYKIPADSDNG